MRHTTRRTAALILATAGALAAPVAAHATPFKSIDPPPPAHHLTVHATMLATRVEVPGHAKTMNVIGLNHEGHRFQVSYNFGTGFVVYGGGVTMRVSEQVATRTYYVTAVSLAGPQQVHITYRMDN